MDEIDRAQAHTDELQTEALRRHMLARSSVGRGSLMCDACGEEIPKKRRELVPGCRLCRECQQEAESHNQISGTCMYLIRVPNEQKTKPERRIKL